MVSKISLRRYTIGGYPPEFNESFKRTIRRREEYKCAICHKKKRLDIHHIDYIKAHTTKENCVAICRECHENIHWSSYKTKIIWKSKLLAYVRKKESDGQRSKRRL